MLITRAMYEINVLKVIYLFYPIETGSVHNIYTHKRGISNCPKTKKYCQSLPNEITCYINPTFIIICGCTNIIDKCYLNFYNVAKIIYIILSI